MFTYIAIMMLTCLLIAFLGRDRKFGFWVYLFASLLLGPHIGFLLVIGSDVQKKHYYRETEVKIKS